MTRPTHPAPSVSLRAPLGVVALVAVLVGCGDPPTMPDAAAGPDAHVLDTHDASELAPDAAISADHDAGMSLDAAPLGDDAAPDPVLRIEGSCGVLDDELADELDHVVENTSHFPEGFERAEATRLSEGAQTILAEGTAGGSSGYSEAFAFEVLHRCEGAALVASETMIEYTTPTPSAIADILVSIDGVPVGVSVTRAVTVTAMCVRADTYMLATASELLGRKLGDLHEAEGLVSASHAWSKGLLFVYADTSEHARVVGEAWAALDPTLRADTILYVSVSEDMDAFVYFEDRCR